MWCFVDNHSFGQLATDDYKPAQCAAPELFNVSQRIRESFVLEMRKRHRLDCNSSIASDGVKVDGDV